MADIPEITRPHPWLSLRHGPVRTKDQHHHGLNGKIALTLTRVVSTMWCAYAFAILAVLGFPTGKGVTAHDYIAWLSQTFIQLTLLSIIMVGQDVAGKAADKRAEQTFNDAEAIIHEMTRLQTRLDTLQAGGPSA